MKPCRKSQKQFHPGDGVCLGFDCPGFHGENMIAGAHQRR